MVSASASCEIGRKRSLCALPMSWFKAEKVWEAGDSGSAAPGGGCGGGGPVFAAADQRSPGECCPGGRCGEGRQVFAAAGASRQGTKRCEVNDEGCGQNHGREGDCAHAVWPRSVQANHHCRHQVHCK
eukprot:1160912-Pelagomonas_calceolata.AAC.1